METLKMIARTTLVGIAVTVVVLMRLFNFIATGVIQLVNSIFGRQSYWDLQNEWDQLCMELDEWHKLWQGRHNE